MPSGVVLENEGYSNEKGDSKCLKSSGRGGVLVVKRSSSLERGEKSKRNKAELGRIERCGATVEGIISEGSEGSEGLWEVDW